MNTKKNAPEKVLQPIQEQSSINNVIIANKTYNVKELKAIFNVPTLMLVENKSELFKYERMAEESGIKHFQNVVDIVWKRKFAV